MTTECGCSYFDTIRNDRYSKFEHCSGVEFQRLLKPQALEYTSSFGSAKNVNFKIFETGGYVIFDDNSPIRFSGRVSKNRGRHNLGTMKATCDECGRKFFVKFVSTTDIPEDMSLSLVNSEHVVRIYDALASSVDGVSATSIFMDCVDEDVTTRVLSSGQFARTRWIR